MLRVSLVAALLGALLISGPSARAEELAAAPAGAIAPGAPSTKDAGPCAAAIAYAERARNIPVHLLQAISLTESGRWSDAHDAFIAWPWTVMAEGKGRYLPSMAAAIAEVKELQARGITNIDVGCMQVNLYYHGDNFASLEDAFNPIHNVAYATTFLTHLRHKRNSWTRAVKEYHSTKPERQEIYRERVMRIWDALKKGRPVGGRETGLESSGFAYISTAEWPPRNYRAQKQMEAAARARVMNGGSQF
ncbi:MAG: transglycosylase SLT domain-containing protein [Alphaproteobacteria bacterium]|nr:transglycosylase SLT domain-containing protein [Alphaproteobacteria bacterium]